MTEIEQFELCTTTGRNRNGMNYIECIYGLWSVESKDPDEVYTNSFHYWLQYKSDGEYYKIIGGASPMEVIDRLSR